jgi:putative hydrolase of the HAD superfamily
MHYPRAVLFDLDDTLTDRTRSIERFAPEFSERFKDQLLTANSSEICRSIQAGDGKGYASREALAAHLQTSLNWRTVPAIEQITTFWRERFPHCNVERDGVTATLNALQKRDLKLGVISNGMTASQYSKLDAMKIRSLFSVILISEEVGIKKPDPQIFKIGLKKLNLPASEVIFIGDNPLLDVAGPAAVGIRAVWLNCDQRNTPANINCPEQISSIDQVIGLCDPEPPHPATG